MRVSVETHLPAPLERAWQVLLSWEEQARWMKDADWVRVRSPHREGVGVRIGVKTRVLGVPLFVEELEVVEWDPPHRLVMAHRSFVRGSGEWRLRADGDGTWFAWTEDLSLPIPVLGEIALRVYRPFMRWLMRGAVDGLGRYLAAIEPT